MRRAWAARRAAAAAAAWAETRAGELGGVTVIGPTPGLVWAHGLGSSCALDDARGVGALLDPGALGRTVLRLDLRGHGRSASVHDPARGPGQYEWNELAKDVRVAARSALSRAFFGGEALGAAVALRAAAAAAASGSVDAPPGLVLMRPPAGLAAGLGDSGEDAAWRRACLAAADAAESGGWAAVERLLAAEGAGCAVAVGPTFAAGAEGESEEEAVRGLRRDAVAPDALAAALRGHAGSAPLGRELEALGKERTAMADDAYGVPLSLQCPVLILALEGDPQHGTQAAEALARALPNAELEVAADVSGARTAWPRKINGFLRKAWMKEFLTKRVMPQ